MPGRSGAARERLIEGEVAVLRIADDDVAGVGEVDPDLVRAAGLDGDVEQAEAGLGSEALGHAHQADRAPASRASSAATVRTWRAAVGGECPCAGRRRSP